MPINGRTRASPAAAVEGTSLFLTILLWTTALGFTGGGGSRCPPVTRRWRRHETLRSQPALLGPLGGPVRGRPRLCPEVETPVA